MRRRVVTEDGLVFGVLVIQSFRCVRMQQEIVMDEFHPSLRPHKRPTGRLLKIAFSLGKS